MVSGRAQGVDVTARPDAALGHADDAGAEARAERERGVERDLEGLQVPAVDADQARPGVQGTRQLLGGMDLDERRQPARLRCRMRFRLVATPP